ncbi:MAG: ComEC/Rec2 family competence protein [Bacilli bacterium]
MNVKNNYAFFLILSGIYFIFLFRKLNRKHLILNAIVFLITSGISYIKISFDREIYNGMVIEAKENYFIFSSSLEKMYVYKKAHEYEIGDYLSIEGEKTQLSFSKIESTFDFENYLNKKGIYSELKYKNINFKFKNPIRLKKLRNTFSNSFDENTSKFVSNILFSTNEDEEVTTNLKEIHLSRFLNMSGLYLYSFYSLLTYVFSIFLKKKTAKGVSLICLLFYVVVSFYKFIVIKFLFFLIFRYINEYYLNKKYSSIQITSIIGITFLIFDYTFAYQDSFIIGMLMMIITNFFNTAIRINNKYIKSLLLNFLMFVSFIPFEISYYHEINLLSFIFQIFFTPVLIALINLCLLSLYGIPFQWLANFIYNSLSKITSILTKFKLTIYLPSINLFSVLLFYGLIILLAYYLYIKHKPMIKITSLCIVSFILVISLPLKNVFSEEVVFINVGQGDATLIRKKETTILIDTGGLKYLDIAKDSLIPFFKKKQIYNIDALITTHDDFDHNGGVDSLIENFKIKSTYINYKFDELKINDISLYNLNRFDYLWSEDNDSSLVINFTLMNTNFLVMGDAPIKIEKEIMKTFSSLDIDILRVGHHGSKTSTSDEFIKFITPKEAIISVGSNYYGHPHKEVLDILNKNNVIIRRTDIEGSISYFKYSLFQ